MNIIIIASRCDEPDWADECLSLFKIENKVSMMDLIDYKEIYKENK